MPNVNPDILIWARENAALTREAAVKKLNLKPAHGVAAVDRLAGFESGKDSPTQSVLNKMAKQYRRPLITFYLPKPPPKADRGVDFRFYPCEVTAQDEALLDTLLRDVRARQSMVRALLVEEDETRSLEFVGSKKVSDGKEDLLNSLYELLGVGREEYRRQKTPEKAFALLRDRAEIAGIFVVLQGDLGSHHSKIDVQVFRGFVIADKLAPFIVINSHDSFPAKSFTLLHELVHLLLGETGVSGMQSENDTEAERFCNDVAGGFLLQTAELDEIDLSDRLSLDEKEGSIKQFALNRYLSHAMVTYAAYRADRLRQGDFGNLYSRYSKQAGEKNHHRDGQKSGGPNYYVVRRNHVGTALIDLTRRMVGTGKLSTTKAAKILGVKPVNVQSLLEVG